MVEFDSLRTPLLRVRGGGARLYELNDHPLRCGPCKAFAPTLERFGAENPDSVLVMKLDIDEFTGIAGEIGIRSVPTLLVVKDGQVVAARSGALSGEALASFLSNAVT
jgi:thioredoxin 1